MGIGQPLFARSLRTVSGFTTVDSGQAANGSYWLGALLLPVGKPATADYDWPDHV